MELRSSVFELSEWNVNGEIKTRNDLSLTLDSQNAGVSNLEQFLNGGIAAIDLAGSLALMGLAAHGEIGPPLQTSKPVLPQCYSLLSMKSWKKIFPDATETRLLNLIAGLGQIFDFWEESHSAAQRADDLGERRLSAQWHAICHRREPDAFNANYWWNRVGKNPIADQITALIENSRELLEPELRTLCTQLLNHGLFSDRAMVSHCCSSSNGLREENFLRKLQKYEFVFVLDVTLDQLL